MLDYPSPSFKLLQLLYSAERNYGADSEREMKKKVRRARVKGMLFKLLFGYLNTCNISQSYTSIIHKMKKTLT